MALARIGFFPGGTEEQYRALREELGDAHHRPDGRLVFFAGAVPEGYQVVQVWRSRAHYERWLEDDFRAAVERVDDRGFPVPPRVTEFEVDDLEEPAAPSGGRVR